MVRLNNPVDPNEVEPGDGGDYPLIAAGWYAACVEDSESKTSAAGNEYPNLRFRLSEEYHDRPAANHVLFLGLHFNASETAASIAARNLADIARAIDFDGPIEDTEDIHHEMMAIRVKIRPAKGEYEARNEISAFAPLAEKEDELRTDGALSETRTRKAPAAKKAAPKKAASGGRKPGVKGPNLKGPRRSSKGSESYDEPPF